MKHQQLSFLLMFGITILITGCQVNPNQPNVPANTEGTFAYVGVTKENPLGFAVFNKKGMPVTPSDKPIPNDKKPVDVVHIKFFNGSCTAEICRPGRPCQTVVLDPVNDCP